MGIMSWIFLTTVLIYSVKTSHPKLINSTGAEPKIQYNSTDTIRGNEGFGSVNSQYSTSLYLNEKSPNSTIQTGTTPLNYSIRAKHAVENDTAKNVTGNTSTDSLDSLKVTEHAQAEAICAENKDDVIIKKLPDPFVLPFPQVFASLYVLAFFIIYFYFTWLACRFERKDNAEVVPNVNLNVYAVP